MSSIAVKWYTLDEYGDLTDNDNYVILMFLMAMKMC